MKSYLSHFNSTGHDNLIRGPYNSAGILIQGRYSSKHVVPTIEVKNYTGEGPMGWSNYVRIKSARLDLVDNKLGKALHV